MVEVILDILVNTLRFLYNLIRSNIFSNDTTYNIKEVKPGILYKREELCRQILEDYFKRPFPKVKANFIRNPKTNRPLELDCYNPDLKIALEHHGIQHYEYPNRYHKSEDEFKELKYRDNIKSAMCQKLGIKLIIVKYDVPEAELKSYILAKLNEKV